MEEFFKRGANLLKFGLAVRQIKKSTTEDQRQWTKQYLIELLGKLRGLPSKFGQFMNMDDGRSVLPRISE